MRGHLVEEVKIVRSVEKYMINECTLYIHHIKPLELHLRKYSIDHSQSSSTVKRY